MTQEEYKKKKAHLESEHDKQLRALDKEYALANSPVKVGDIVEDHIGKIRVESIQWRSGERSSFPSCVYNGIILNRFDKPTGKKQNKRAAYQSNMKYYTTPDASIS